MSNASNLSTLANVLDDGTSGQFLKSTGSGGVAFDTVAAGAVVYATADLLPLSGFAAGDMAYVTATNRFYINNGSGWYSVSLVNTNPNITSVADASSNTTPFTLATDGTATVITVTAADPEEVPLTYGYSVTSGSLNGSTVAQGTGSNTNVFTVTPHASQDATFTITFTASDGINQATSANAFTLSFVTVVADSNHTILLATATAASDNNNITDSSSNSHSITVNGDAYAGTFSPYRSGGYSTYFDGSGDYLDISASSNFDFGTGDFTFEFSFYAEANTGTWQYLVTNRASGWGAGVFRFMVDAAASNIYCTFFGYDLGGYDIEPETWYHVSAVKSGDTITLYLNGATPTAGAGWYQSHSGVNNVSMGSSSKSVQIGSAGTSDYFKGYIRDLRIVKGTAITPSSGGPTERLTAVANTSLLTCHLPYIADGSTNDHTITVNGGVSTKPFSPYDYSEYSATDHGGSVYFDGNQDYILGNSGTNLGTGNWTVEGWMYITDTSSDRMFIDFRPFSNGDYVTLKFESSDSKMYFFAGNSNRIASNDLIVANSWVHIALVRSSGTIKMYINGNVQTQTYASTANYLSHSSRPVIGINGDNTTSDDMYGYISDVRVSIGTAHYNTNFIPPTTPLSSSGAELHIKGTDASIIDKSQNGNIKIINNTTGSSTNKGGNWNNTYSIYFDGAQDGLVMPINQTIGTGDFTIEAFVKLIPDGSNSYGIFQSHTSSTVSYSSSYTNSIGFYLTAFDNNPRALCVSGYDGASTYGTGYAPLSYYENNWRHIAVAREGTNLRIYVEGNLVRTHTNSNSISPTYIGVGGFYDDTNSFKGNISDGRLTVGKARYTAADETANIPSAPLEG